MTDQLTDGERLMAYMDVGKVINESGTGMFAIVKGIGQVGKLVVHTDKHIFEFDVINVSERNPSEVVKCARCNEFAVPSPLDNVGEALMAAHLTVCKA